MSVLSELTLRPAVPAEHALIFATWIRTQNGTPFAKAIRWSVYARGLHHVIEALLEHVVVAEYRGIVVGYAALEPDVVHYVFVKDPYRGKGIAKRLLGELLERRDVRFSHLPAHWRKVKIPSSWTFDPFAAWLAEKGRDPCTPSPD